MSWEVFVPAPVIRGAVARFTWLNSNHRPHWSQRAKVTKAWRENAKAAVQHTPNVPFFEERVRIVATFHKPRGGRFDVANLAPVVKAAVDGAVDAGVLRDDSNEYVEGPDLRPGEPRPDDPGVVLSFETLREREPA